MGEQDRRDPCGARRSEEAGVEHNVLVAAGPVGDSDAQIAHADSRRSADGGSDHGRGGDRHERGHHHGHGPPPPSLPALPLARQLHERDGSNDANVVRDVSQPALRKVSAAWIIAGVSRPRLMEWWRGRSPAGQSRRNAACRLEETAIAASWPLV